ncbi:hypothetical protein NL676_024175 [Syzygium grande]|nr:hypothetical protein NL676_024175 [Syzygium grande]
MEILVLQVAMQVGRGAPHMDDSGARRRGTPFSVFECESIHPSLSTRTTRTGTEKRGDILGWFPKNESLRSIVSASLPAMDYSGGRNLLNQFADKTPQNQAMENRESGSSQGDEENESIACKQHICNSSPEGSQQVIATNDDSENGVTR